MLTSSSSGALIRRFGYAEAFRKFKNAGLEAMDFPINDGVSTVEDIKKAIVYGKAEAQIMEYYGGVKDIADKAGVKIGQTHSMFGGYAMETTPEFAEVIRNSIIATRALGCDVTVVHPVKTPSSMGGLNSEESVDVNEKFYGQFVPYCKKYNVRIAIENMWALDDNKVISACTCSNPAEMVELVRRLGSDCFCTCADIGHFALTEHDTKITVGDAIRTLGDTLGVLHLHEVNLTDDTHTVPYTFNNVMDWEDIISALREVGYKGIMNFEVMPHIKPYPDMLCDEAMRHISAIAHYFADRLEA